MSTYQPPQIPTTLRNRDTYIARIRPFIGKNLIKVLTGQRRVGKSCLLFQLMREIGKSGKKARIIYINKEDLRFDAIRTARDLNNYVQAQTKKNAKNYIFIDEIQDIENFETALRSLLLDQNNDLYITGSNAKMLSGELATYLSGRYIEFPIHSLSYPEFLQFHNLPDTDETLTQYLTYGGLPYLINLPLNPLAFEYIKSIYSTIVFRDVVSRHNIRNTVFLERLIAFLAGNTGNLFSAKKISDYLKSQKSDISVNRILTHTAHLANAFLIHQVPRYDITGRRIFEVGEKYYFENLGIRNAITGYRPADAGKLLENAVYNHLLYTGWKVMVGVLPSGEIDFVCEKSGETKYVQAALRLDGPKTIEREFGNLQKINDNYPKYVISTDPTFPNTHAGITHLHIRKFLMQE